MRTTFFAAQTYNGVQALPPVGVALGNQQMAGYVADYDVRGSAQVDTAARNRAPLMPLLVDPGWRYGRLVIANQPTATWLRGSPPSTRGEWDAVVRDAIAAQRLLGADYLVAPGVEMSGGTGVAAVQRQVAAIRAAYRSRPQSDPPWLARICIHDEWLFDPTQRRNLLDEVSDFPDPVGIALHVRWRRRGVSTDRGSLEALKPFIETLVRDDRLVVLLRSGVVGWLASAWGAAGWSAGLPRSSWTDESRGGGGRARGSTNKKWFFEHDYFVWVEDSQHAQLAAHQNYAACPCSFCNALASGAPWAPTAAQHALYTLARLAAQTSATSTQAQAANVRSIISNAKTAWANRGAGQTLNTRRQEATHLVLWESLV